MWTFLRRDGYVRAWLLAWLLIDGAQLLAPSATAQEWLFQVGNALLLPVSALILIIGSRQLPLAPRRFWYLLIGGVAFWWTASLLGIAAMTHTPGLWLSLAVDMAFSLLYLCFLLALESRADGETGFAGSVGRRLEGFGAFALIVGLFSYFVGVPAVYDVERYLTGVPSLILFFTLDLFLAGRFLRRGLRMHSKRWRSLYGGLCLTTLLMACFDVAELAGATGWLSEPIHPWWNVFWRLPLLVLVVTARLRFIPLDNEDSDGDGAPLRTELGSPLVACGFCFPLLHYGLYITGMLASEGRQARELIVFVAVLVFGSLAILENTQLRRRGDQLARQHREIAQLSAQRSNYLNSLIQNSPLAIVVLDGDNRIRICNPAFERLFGYHQKEAAGLPIDDLINDTTTRSQALAITDRVSDGEAVQITAQRRRKDGTPIDVEVHGVPLFTQGLLTGVFAIYQDIGDRLRSEEALRESEERFRLLAEASFEGIVVSDDGTILDANEQYARMVGSSSQGLIGRHVLEHVALEDHPKVEAKLAEGNEHPYHHHAIRDDGSRFLVEVHGRTMPYDGRPLRVTTIRDITEQKRLEEEIRQSQKMEVVGRLAGSIAHDFNNILTIITGYGQLLASQLGDHPLAEMAEEIRQAARRASMLTQRLLDFSRKRPAQVEASRLGNLLRDMEKMMRRLLPADIELHLRLDADDDIVMVDPGQMEQMVLNLVVNAGDAMPRGGILVLTTTQTTLSRQRRVADLEPGPYVCLEVRDTGSGMDEDTLSHAFDPFFTTKERGKGTGLGLSTVYNIVRQSHGAITVDSQLEEGTRFCIYLPQVTSSVALPDHALDGTRRPLAASVDGATVLVVEDEPGVRRLAVETLGSLGYLVLEAGDGQRALTQIRQEPSIDLVLTDMVMPELNGPEMVEQALALRSDLKVLYMTGYADEHLRRRGVIAGSYILQKPFSVEDLAERVREALDGRPGGLSKGEDETELDVQLN